MSQPQIRLKYKPQCSKTALASFYSLINIIIQGRASSTSLIVNVHHCSNQRKDLKILPWYDGFFSSSLQCVTEGPFANQLFIQFLPYCKYCLNLQVLFYLQIMILFLVCKYFYNFLQHLNAAEQPNMKIIVLCLDCLQRLISCFLL